MLDHATPTTPAQPAPPPPAALRTLVVGAVGGVVVTAAVLAAVLVVVNRADWWRGYVAASVAAALATGASLVPLTYGLRKGGAAVVQMFMASSALRGAVAIGIAALAVGVGGYPALPTLGLVIPYYLALLAIETACLSRGIKSIATKA